MAGVVFYPRAAGKCLSALRPTRGAVEHNTVTVAFAGPQLLEITTAMKKLMLVLTALAVMIVGVAYSGPITVTTNATPATGTIVVPPVVNFGSGYLQIASRDATNTSGTVAMGEYRRVGDVVCIAANAGTLTAERTTNTVITAGGTYYGTNLITGLVVTQTVAAVTNTVITRKAISVPLTGLSAVDGTVYWLRVPASRGPVIVQARIPLATATVTLTDSDGGITMFHDDYEKETFTSGKLLYAKASGTNTCTVSVIEQ